MSNKDTFEHHTIIFYLDKPYRIRFTMRAIFILEEIYGSFKNALDNLKSENAEETVNAVFNFLYALIAVEKTKIDEYMDIEKFRLAHEKIMEALVLHLPDADENAPKSTSDAWDWDTLYFMARYRLNMTDDEFMNCIPRRFDKLSHLWRVANGLEKSEPKKMFIDEIVF